MTDEQEQKLERLKRTSKLKDKVVATFDYKIEKKFYETLNKHFDNLVEMFGDLADSEKDNTAQLVKLFDSMLTNKDLNESLIKIEQAIKGQVLPDNKEVRLEGLKSLVQAVKDNRPLPFPVEKVEEVTQAITELREQITKQTIPQRPQDFVPMRRVVSIGNRLIFDDGLTGMNSGGGGGGSSSSSSSSSGTVVIADEGGEAVTVTNGKLDVNASVDTTGLATSAKQDTIIGHLDGVETSLSNIDTDTTTIIGHLDGVETLLTDIEADTDTLAVVGGGAEATALRVTIANDSTGVLSVDDNGSSLTVDNAGLTELAAAINASSQVDVNIAAGNITGFATSAKQDTIIGHVDGIEGLLTTIAGDTTDIEAAIELIDDVVFAEDVAASAADKGLAILAVRRDADTTLVDTTNDYANLQVDARGALKVEVFSGEALPVTMTSTTITGTVAVTQSGTWDEVGINDSGNSITVDNGGTFAVQDATAQASLSVMDDWDNAASDGASVSGDVAHDTADAGEPVKIGMKAVALKANPTEVAANDRTNWYADVSGVPFVLPGHPNILSQSLQVTDADGAQTDTAIITAGANVAVVVTKVSVMADNANTGDVSVRIGFGTANTPAADAAQVLLFHPGIAPGSGVVEGAGAGILGIGASNEDVRVTCEDPAGGSINIIVTYFTTDI